MSRRLGAWGPAAVWAGVIFFLSTDAGAAERSRHLLEPILRWLWPGISAEALEAAHAVSRKTAHLGEYFVFAVLLDRAFRVGEGVATRVAPLYALLVAALYSLSDEWHQSWVASRTASLIDCGFDSVGAAAAALWRLVRRSRNAD